jgi:hypothetical protein
MLKSAKNLSTPLKNQFGVWRCIRHGSWACGYPGTTIHGRALLPDLMDWTDFLIAPDGANQQEIRMENNYFL